MGTYINGVYYNDQGQAVDPNTGQPLGGTTPTGIGGAPAGPSPIQAQLQAAAAAQPAHTYTPMTAEQLYATRNPRQAQLNAQYTAQGGAAVPFSGVSQLGLNGLSGGTGMTSPYPNNPYQVTGAGPGAFQSNGQSFSIEKTNPDGTINWVRSDGTRFNNLSRDEFAKYFGSSVGNQYYGTPNLSQGQYQATGVGDNSFSAGGNQFNVTRNADGTVSLARSDGQNINNLSQTDFARYFGADLASKYYGNSGVGNNTAPGGTGTAYTPPAYDPNSATAQNPFLNIGLNAYSQTQQPYNPGYLNDVSKSLWNQATTNLNENVFPGMDSQAIAAGGYGGDRSYLAKGVAADRMNQSVFNAMAPQYQSDYNAWQNRALAGGQGAAGVGQGLESLGLQQTLGLGNLNLGQYNADTQRQLGLGGLNLGQYNADTTRQLGLGDLGVKQYAAESNAAYQAGQTANPQYTNPWAAAIGAGGLGLQLWNTLFGNKQTTNP